MIMAPYEDFKFQNSLAGAVYPTSPQKDEDEADHDNAAEAIWHLEDTVKERGKFSYSFSEFQCTWFLSKFCCCLIKKESLWWKRRSHHYERYEKACDRMSEEIDIRNYF